MAFMGWYWIRMPTHLASDRFRGEGAIIQSHPARQTRDLARSHRSRRTRCPTTTARLFRFDIGSAIWPRASFRLTTRSAMLSTRSQAMDGSYSLRPPWRLPKIRIICAAATDRQIKMYATHSMPITCGRSRWRRSYADAVGDPWLMDGRSRERSSPAPDFLIQYSTSSNRVIWLRIITSAESMRCR